MGLSLLLNPEQNAGSSGALMADETADFRRSGRIVRRG